MTTELIITDDGSQTLKHSLLGELYHSSRGAIGESMHVFINAGLEHILQNFDSTKISIFEVGFGSGLNAYLTMNHSTRDVDYHTIEKYPIDHQTVTQLNYTSTEAERANFESLHTSTWNGQIDHNPISTQITDSFTLTKYSCDIESFNYNTLSEKFHLIYFDAFSPEVQPELWSEEIMHKMYSILQPQGILVTYSSKGLVKSALRTAGFEIKRMEGALGKRHMLRATKP